MGKVEWLKKREEDLLIANFSVAALIEVYSYQNHQQFIKV